jgi:membrane protein
MVRGMTSRRGPRSWLGLRPRHRSAPHLPWLVNFFADRGTHLAAMIAYYALLSFVPLLFLMLFPLQFIGQQTESSFLIRQLSQAFPGQSVDDIVQVVNDLRGPGTTLGLIGLALLLWSALGLLSAIGSALNIIYEVPNRPFLQQKGQTLLLVLGAIIGLVTLLTVVTTLSAFARSYASSVFGILSVEQLLGIVFSSTVMVAFLFVIYRYIPNTTMTSREVLPGVAFSTLTMQAGFLCLPLYLDAINTVASLKALGGIVVLLVWFFLMSNILLLGAEINWWYGRGRHGARRMLAEPSDDPRAG